MKLTPPKHSTFLFSLFVGIASFIAFFAGIESLGYFLALAALIDLLMGCYFKDY
jgi:hypothetical protein